MAKLRLSVVLGVLAAVLAVGTAMALPPQIPPTTVPYGMLVSGSRVSDAATSSFARVFSSRDGVLVFTAHAKFAPGGTLGWHSHPGPNLHTIVSGTLTVYEVHGKTCARKDYGPGEGFVDPGYGNVHIGINESATEPVDFYVTFFNPGGVETWSTPEQPPAECASLVR